MGRKTHKNDVLLRKALINSRRQREGTVSYTLEVMSENSFASLGARDQVNLLVYRYLQESGFSHSAFTFGVESHISQSNINGDVISRPSGAVAPPNSLESYISSENSRNESIIVGRGSPDGRRSTSSDSNLTVSSATLSEDRLLVDMIVFGMNRNLNTRPIAVEESNVNTTVATHPNPTTTPSTTQSSLVAANPIQDNSNSNIEIPSSRATVLPASELLASGSGDSTARIWNMSESTQTAQQLVLRHCIQKGGTEVPSNKDVTSLDWNSDGTPLATGSYNGWIRTLLATGVYDGFARIWTTDGRLVSTLCQHKAPIFATPATTQSSLVAAKPIAHCFRCSHSDLIDI